MSRSELLCPKFMHPRCGCKSRCAMLTESTATRTGRTPDMLQDDCRPLSRWLANRIDSRKHAREAAAAAGDKGRTLE
jgi:hypothetical protein